MLEKCITCESGKLKKIFELKEVPLITQKLLPIDQAPLVPKVDLLVYRCETCKLVQVDPEIVSHDQYWEDYLNSRGMTELYTNYENFHATYFFEKFGLSSKKVIEIGPGDGSFLEKLREQGAEILAVEPSKKAAAELESKGIKTLNRYADKNLSKELTAKFDAFVCRQVIDLVKSPREMIRSIASVLKPGAVGLIDVPSWTKTITDFRYYSILPDRFCYFTAYSLANFLEEFNFHVLEIFHGAEDEYVGAYVIYEGRDDGLLLDFSENHSKFNVELDKVLNSFDEKAEVVGWGAGAKGVTIYSQSKTLTEKTAYIVDSDKTRWNNGLPGTEIVVFPPSRLSQKHPDVVVITASMFYKEIVADLGRKYSYRGKIVVLTPNPRVLSDDEVKRLQGN